MAVSGGEGTGKVPANKQGAANSRDEWLMEIRVRNKVRRGGALRNAYHNRAVRAVIVAEGHDTTDVSMCAVCATGTCIP